MQNPASEFKSGYVTILGPPNVGKSTLLNRILGEKISITSKKPQTTRNRILGVLHRPGSQIVFLDTPGVHPAKAPLNVRIVDLAMAAMADADILLLMADLVSPDTESESMIVQALQRQKRPAVLALNKTDGVDPGRVLAAIGRWADIHPFDAIVPISALTGEMVDDLLDAMEKTLAPGPPFFPEDTLTDMPLRFIAAEIIREKVFRLTGEEIPYAVAVTVDAFKRDTATGVVRIGATINVERDSQKGIIIGKKGSKLKQIGQNARVDIEKMVDARVYLKLFVRVQKNWSRDTRALRRFGY